MKLNPRKQTEMVLNMLHILLLLHPVLDFLLNQKPNKLAMTLTKPTWFTKLQIYNLSPRAAFFQSNFFNIQ